MCFSQKFYFQKKFRGHTDLNHGPIGLQPIALPLSYIPDCHYYREYLGGNYNYVYIVLYKDIYAGETSSDKT